MTETVSCVNSYRGGDSLGKADNSHATDTCIWKKMRRVLPLTCVVLIPHLITNLIFFPGFIQADHQSLIAHIAINQPSQWHSLLWGYLAFPLLYLSPSYGVYGIIQTCIFTTCAVYSIASLRSMNMISHKAELLLALIFGLSPTYLLYNQLYASDVVFAYLCIPLTVQLIKLVRSNGDALNSRSYKLSLILLAFLVFQLRKNAVLIPIGIFAITIIEYKVQRKSCFKCIVAFLLSAIAASAFWTYAVKATPSPSQEMLSVPAQQIGRTFSRNGDIPEATYDYFTSFRSEKDWRESYLPYTADPEKAGLLLDSDFIKNWFIIGLHNPLVYVDAYVDQMNPFWKLSSSPEALNINVDFSKHDLFTTDICNSKCKGTYVSQITRPYSSSQIWASDFQNKLLSSRVPFISDVMTLVFFNQAIPLWLFAIGLLLSVKKKCCIDYLIITMPLLCILISLLCFAPIASFRYAFQAFGMLPIIVAYLASIKKTTKPQTRTSYK